MRRTLRLALTLAVVASGLVLPTALAEAVTRPRTLYHEHPVTSAPIEPGFPIDDVGVVFDLPDGADAHHDHGPGDVHEGVGGLAVRFRHGDLWGPWTPMTEDGAQAPGQWTGALVSGDDADAYQIRGLPGFARSARAAALNTTDGPREIVARRPAASADAVTTCKSRADWLADESLRTSTRSYAPTQVLTVHHTATQNDDPDPDARVRAIYTYHVRTNRWDDIGYQALISEDGTVYEGRWSGSDSPSCLDAGGTGWEFGHRTTATASEIVTGAHTGGYNTGNFGIALLGTLTDVPPKTAAREALVEYLAELSGRHGLDPQGTVDYDNGVNRRTVATISGHRDFTATECPGGVLYDDLPAVRTDVASRLSGSTPATPTVVDDVAAAETTVSGTVTGSYLDTHGAGGAVEALTELESGGKPSTRTSLLEHIWDLNVTGGDTVTFSVDAAATSSAEDFTFAYSTDGGSTYTTLVTVAAGSRGVSAAAMPAGTRGAVKVRVTDADRTAGNNSLDTIDVDHLFIRSDSTVLSDPPPAPTTVTASATGATTARVTWTDVTTESGYEVERTTASATAPDTDWTSVASVATDTTAYDDSGLRSSTTYWYRVRAVNRAGASHWTLSDGVTTAAAASIELSASGRKTKGEHRIDLSWTGATAVSVHRDSVHIADVDGSSFTDVIAAKGSATYTHWVCLRSDPTVCSNRVTTTF
ncbi:MAG: N-acetylmuramoyl-L-alanine amidase [Actinomycetota bacterium]|nr:N-acetylmuramoyl-L-alanine amidase [Actinomycetota bacterium]